MLTYYDDLHVHLIFDRFLFHMRVHLYEYIPVFTMQHNYQNTTILGYSDESREYTIIRIQLPEFSSSCFTEG